MDIFSQYAPFIQEYIYAQGWPNLRPIQVGAADAIFNTKHDVLVCGPTASGKTEAAFFPILTLLEQEAPNSIGCLYISPLKALINDQFSRLSELCRDSEVKVWRYHGDVAQTQKRALIKNPTGVLQITPESLEALMINKHAEIPRLFGDLRFIVIDELHSFLRSDRGAQTFSLIERLSKLAACDPRRIGLSATIGDPQVAGEFLSAGSKHGVSIPQARDTKQVWRLSMEHFYNTDPQSTESVNDLAQPVLDQATDSAPDLADPSMAYIFDHTRGKKCLVFTNSREECEAVCQILRQYCEINHEPDRFLIHHGNLSTSYRQTAEEAMKDDNVNVTTLATATLELGIDIGRLERAFQIDSPFTVSGFLQRMGRTGRRGNPPEMWFVMREQHLDTRALLPELFSWPLLQGIALVQLYAQERFVEPPRKNRLPYSLLYHQTMSELAACGEMTPAELSSRILSINYFKNVTQADFRLLLQHLLATDHIQMTENHGLMIGIAGERVVNNFKFYAVFQENEEFSVHNESEELGTIVKPPPVGEKVAIAGRVWVVEEVDQKRHQVYVSLVKGRVPAYFGDVAGDIHPKILQKMREILTTNDQYPYLMNQATARLAQMRTTASQAGMVDHTLINLGGKMWCLFPWTGSYAFLALERLLKLKCADQLGLKGLTSSRPYFMQFTMDATAEEFFKVVKEQANADFDPLELVYENEVPLFDKYDEFLPSELVRKGFAHGILDLDELRNCVNKLQ